jgi:hypothetical protein
VLIVLAGVVLGILLAFVHGVDVLADAVANRVDEVVVEVCRHVIAVLPGGLSRNRAAPAAVALLAVAVPGLLSWLLLGLAGASRAIRNVVVGIALVVAIGGFLVLPVSHAIELAAGVVVLALLLRVATSLVLTLPLVAAAVALGIRHVGPTGARALARAFGTLDALRHASADELGAVEGVGSVIAGSVAEFFSNPKNVAVVERLVALGLRTDEPVAPGMSVGARPSGPAAGPKAGATVGAESEIAQTLAGKSVVVTGTLEGYSREEAEAAIISRGGKSPGTVSKRTFAVVVGASPGAAKTQKAAELGIPVVDGARFDELLATGEVPG